MINDHRWTFIGPHAETMDGFDGDDFQLSQDVAEYEQSQSDLIQDIGFGYFDLKDCVWKLFPS